MKRFRVVSYDSDPARGWDSGMGRDTIQEALDLLDRLITKEHDFTGAYPCEVSLQLVDTKPEPPKIILFVDCQKAIDWRLTDDDKWNQCGPNERPWVAEFPNYDGDST